MFFQDGAGEECNLIKIPDPECNNLLEEMTLDRSETGKCVSETHAFEIDYSENCAKIHELLLDQDDLGDRKPGVILKCRQEKRACEAHRVQLMEVISAWNMPVFVRVAS